MSEEKSVWSSPWLWGTGGCCLGCIVLPIGLVALLGGVGVFTLFRAGGVVDLALEKARAHPEVVEALGEPIERGWQFQGNINIDSEGGHADVRVPIHGPNGSGQLVILADRENGVWEFERLEVQIEGRDTIDLLDDSLVQLLVRLVPLSV